MIAAVTSIAMSGQNIITSADERIVNGEGRAWRPHKGAAMGSVWGGESEGMQVLVFVTCGGDG